nr:MAG TPA: hypothetical protein [Caudoviricetes sp.]
MLRVFFDTRLHVFVKKIGCHFNTSVGSFAIDSRKCCFHNCFVFS